MKQANEPKFTFINYSVCNYCTHLVREAYRDGYNRGCELRQNERGQYARLTPFTDEPERLKKRGIDAICSAIGCENFEASGLPAHPKVYERLVKQNPKASTIPTDLKALETSWGFEYKIRLYPHKEIDLYFEKDGEIVHQTQ